VSEYQYYEFQAVERPLSRAAMDELRALSSRAKITPTRFQNVYHYGDFKGEPLALMQTYFDAFVYVANWGTNWLMLRLPRGALDPETLYPYCVDEGITLHVERDHVIVELMRQDEDGGGWIEDEEAESWLPALLPLRTELMRGDQRGLYLAWLAGAQRGLLEDDEAEPPVPPGLASPSAAQEALAQFLDLDADWLATAAKRSAAPRPPPTTAAVEQWVRALPVAEQEALLLRLARGEALDLAGEFVRRTDPPSAPRAADLAAPTVRALRAAAEAHAETRRRQEAERKTAARARREREAAAAREKYLDSLVGSEGTALEPRRGAYRSQARERIRPGHPATARSPRPQRPPGARSGVRGPHGTLSRPLRTPPGVHGPAGSRGSVLLSRLGDWRQLAPRAIPDLVGQQDKARHGEVVVEGEGLA
jgi:hypothetical protein